MLDCVSSSHVDHLFGAVKVVGKKLVKTGVGSDSVSVVVGQLVRESGIVVWVVRERGFNASVVGDGWVRVFRLLRENVGRLFLFACLLFLGS